jgi:glycosyltransferase involved in cell wall biosynthesis
MYDKRLSLRSKFSIPPNEIVLLYSGKIIEDKGIEKIIKIGKKWKEKSNFSLTLVLIGSGKVSYINFLRNKTSKAQINFKYFTGVSHKDLPLYFNLANFCFWIGSPSISMYEAAMCGIPIVISRNSKRGFVARNTHGFVFDDNYDEVVNWLNENSDAIVWHKLSEDVFNQAEALYTWEKIYLRLKNKFFPN